MILLQLMSDHLSWIRTRKRILVRKKLSKLELQQSLAAASAMVSFGHIEKNKEPGMKLFVLNSPEAEGRRMTRSSLM